MVDTNNINITVSLSDDTLEKLAAKQLKVKEPKQWVRDNFHAVINSANARPSLKAKKK